MNNPQDNLENLINRLNKTPLEKEMLLNLPKEEQEMLNLIAELKSVPIFKVPIATSKNKFTTKKTPNFWDKYVFNYKVSLSFVSLIVIVFSGALFYGATTSLPGEKLFGIKKTAEQFRVKFAASEIQKAYLKVQIAKKRIAEAEKLAKQTNASPKLELAAIFELSQATDSAVTQVENLPPKTLNNETKPILESLEAVSNKEKTLISTLGADSEEKNDVIALSLKNSNKVSEIKQSVAIATAEEAIASLSKTTNIIGMSGTITNLQKNKLVVEKTEFIIDSLTEIVNQDGKTLSYENLKIGNSLAITGKKTENGTLAIKIIISNIENKNGEVKGVTDPVNTTTVNSILNIEPTNKEIETTNPNQASTGYIIEDPTPQFNP